MILYEIGETTPGKYKSIYISLPHKTLRDYLFMDLVGKDEVVFVYSHISPGGRRYTYHFLIFPSERSYFEKYVDRIIGKFALDNDAKPYIIECLTQLRFPLYDHT